MKLLKKGKALLGQTNRLPGPCVQGAGFFLFCYSSTKRISTGLWSE